MCGRFSLWSDKNKILIQFGLSEASGYRQSYNVTPSSNIPIVRDYKGREMINCHWGLIPHWAKDTKLKPINARAETLTEKPMFRGALNKRRCLIPANGFFEWQGPTGRKQPFYIKPREAELFAFAGLWDHWDSPDQEIDSCTIITTSANDAMVPIHERMPVIIDPENYDQWLEQGGTELLVPYSRELDIFQVSNQVNNPKHDDQSLIQPGS